ncbi:MAG: cell envelope biogenesis protein OmpA [Chitinophagales bacterium]|nr:MAG: cell envelope biogenesis protein OmpA [Chitinophagales bacterium]
MKKVCLHGIVLMILFTSCVSSKKLEQEQARSKNLQLENEALLDELQKMTLLKTSLDEENDSLKKSLAHLQNDAEQLNRELQAEKKKYTELNKLYDDLVEQNKKLLSASSAEKQKLLADLENQKRELAQKEQELNAEKAKIDQLSAELTQREKRLKDLEDLVSRKDAAIADLKKRIENALLSFNKDELSVEIKDGKIYVSLQEKLLFKSGSAVVDAKGRDALNKLADVLARQTDVDILIEGHTDNDPIKTECIKDNWDLSVLRATAIVRILQENKGIRPERFIASGRSEYVPVAPNTTKEGKAKNRRTEIILAPRLDEIFKILESPN